MHNRLIRLGWSCSLLILGAALLGGVHAAKDPELAPPAVAISQPVAREVTDYEDYTGRTEAVANVELRARVTGYIDKVHVKSGATVKRGDVLFEIDARPYRAELDQADAEV